MTFYLGPWRLYRVSGDSWETGWSVALLCPTCNQRRQP